MHDHTRVQLEARESPGSSGPCPWRRSVPEPGRSFAPLGTAIPRYSRTAARLRRPMSKSRVVTIPTTRFPSVTMRR